MVNGKNKTRAEVEELLMSKGIDLENNRFLILQGEVEQIATMKAKGQTEHETGLLEYIEDVVGSNRFVEQIAEKGSALETMNEERALKLNRVKAVEGERERAPQPAWTAFWNPCALPRLCSSVSTRRRAAVAVLTRTTTCV